MDRLEAIYYRRIPLKDPIFHIKDSSTTPSFSNSVYTRISFSSIWMCLYYKTQQLITQTE